MADENEKLLLALMKGPNSECADCSTRNSKFIREKLQNFMLRRIIVFVPFSLSV